MSTNQFLGYDPQEEPGLAPEGEYTLKCVSAVLATAKNNPNNRMLICEFEFVEKNYDKITLRFNIHNDNPTAEKIGRRELKSFMKSIGIDPEVGPDTEEDFIDMPFLAFVKQTYNKAFDVEENSISQFKRINLMKKKMVRTKDATSVDDADKDDQDEEPTTRRQKRATPSVAKRNPKVNPFRDEPEDAEDEDEQEDEQD